MVNEEDNFSKAVRETIELLAESEVDEIMQKEYPAPPPGTIEPEDVWKARKRKEVLDKITGVEESEKISNGQILIFEYLERELSPIELQNMKEDWDKGISAICQRLNDENNIETYEEIMGLKTDTMDLFYKAGLYYFNEKKFKEAAEVFTTINWLNPDRNNVWLALGMSYENDEKIDLALPTYEIAASLDDTDPLPYIHIGECKIKNNNIQEAKENLLKALEITKIADNNVENKDELILYINKLLKSANN